MEGFSEFKLRILERLEQESASIGQKFADAADTPEFTDMPYEVKAATFCGIAIERSVEQTLAILEEYHAWLLKSCGQCPRYKHR